MLSKSVIAYINKINTIREQATPITVKDLQKFLGFANFYCRLSCNLKLIAALLTSLLKKGDQEIQVDFS